MILFFQTVFISLISFLNPHEHVYYIDNSQLIRRNINTENIEVLDFKNPDMISLDNYELMVKNSDIFFISRNSVIVYKLENNSLTRIDKSLDNRLLGDSYIFSHNDTIFRYGGYGFWSQRNFMIYFDENFKEWEFYPTNPESYEPDGSYKGIYFKSDSEVYFIGGQSIDKQNKLKSKNSTELIKFDFNTNKFEYVGKLNFHFNYSSLIVKDDLGFAVNSGTQIAYVNPKENSIQFYNKTSQQLNLRIHEGLQNQNKYYNDNYLIEIFRNSDLANEKVIISKSNFYNNKTSETKLYKNSFIYIPSLSSLLILLFILFSTIYVIDRIRLNHIILNSKGIVYRRILNSLNFKEINFMNQIIKESFISTKSVLKIVENTNLSYPHNIKIKDQFIKELNLKLKTIFNTDYTPLEVRSSKIDARIKEHFFNKNFNKFIKRLSVRI